MSIWLQPSGSLDVTGFALESPFLRAALDRIGVEPQMSQRSEYKGAVNASPTRPCRSRSAGTCQGLMDSWFGSSPVTWPRPVGLTPEAVTALVNKAPYDGAQGPEMGLIDHLGYRDQAPRRGAGGREGPDAEFVSLAAYAERQCRNEPESEGARSRAGSSIALIYGTGPVTLGEGDNDPVFGEVTMGSDTVAAALAQAIDDRLRRGHRLSRRQPGAGPTSPRM